MFAWQYCSVVFPAVISQIKSYRHYCWSGYILLQTWICFFTTMTEMCKNMIVNYVPDLSLWKCSCNYNIELKHVAFRRVICDIDDETLGLLFLVELSLGWALRFCFWGNHLKNWITLFLAWCREAHCIIVHFITFVSSCFSYSGGSSSCEFGDFSVISCLTGWLPEAIPLQ